MDGVDLVMMNLGTTDMERKIWVQGDIGYTRKAAAIH
jgi:hypothetical protein